MLWKRENTQKSSDAQNEFMPQLCILKFYQRDVNAIKIGPFAE